MNITIILSISLWCSMSYASHQPLHIAGSAATFFSIASGCVGIVAKPLYANHYWKLIGFGVLCGGITYFMINQHNTSEIVENQISNINGSTSVIDQGDDQPSQSGIAMFYYKMILALNPNKRR